LISRPFSGRLLDVKGANYVMSPAFILLTAGMLILGSAHSSFTLLLAGSLIGLGFGNMQSCTQAIAIKMTSPERMGLATSTFFIFLDAGLGLGPYLLGFFIPTISYSILYMMLGVVVLASSGLYFLLHGKKGLLLKL
jgi:predicted MFS family arabinose efflux permease